jgi:NAD(P)H-dependent FMN reductase
MEKTPLKVQIIIGSTRKGRFADKPAKWIYEEAKKQKDIEAEIVDLRDFPLPFFDEKAGPSSLKNYETKGAKEWAANVAKADAFIIVAPEYNHGYTAVLKNAMDYVYYEWNMKPVAFISYGSVAGARAIEQLRLVAIELQMAPIRKSLHIQDLWGSVMDEKGGMKPGALDHMKDDAAELFKQLIWWGKALKAARR